MQSIEDAKNKTKSLGQVLRGRDNYFDLIRLIAAIMVIFSHAYPLSGVGYDDLLYRFSNGQVTLGNLAVYIFFIISGLLITQSYLYSNNLITFLKSRLLRIFPGLLGVLLVSAFFIGPLVTSLSFNDYISNEGVLNYLKAFLLFPMQWNLPGVFEHNAYKGIVNGSLWTIPFEFICYLVVAVLGFFKILNHRYFVLFLTLCLFYYYIFNNTISPSGAGHIFGLEIGTLSELLLFFLMGSLACLFKDKIYLNKQIAMIGIFILYISLYYGGFKSIFAVFGAYLILFIAFLPATKLSMITARGDFSYGVYLYAFPIQQSVTFLFGGKTSVVLNFVISLVVTIICAILSWYLIEKRFLNLKKYKLPGESIVITSLLDKNKQFYNIKLFCKSVFRMGWIHFFAFFIVFVLGFTFYNVKPTVIEFPYNKSESIFHGGWLEQNNGENYRWIKKEAVVELSFSDKAQLSIEGYVPENFVEINKMNIYIDNNLINQTKVKYGEGFFVKIPVNSNAPSQSVKIEFNGVHIPAATEADQREMSALISKISVK